MDGFDVAGVVLRLHPAPFVDHAHVAQNVLDLGVEFYELARRFVTFEDLQDGGKAKPAAKVGRLIHALIFFDGPMKPFEVEAGFASESLQENSPANFSVLCRFVMFR